MKLRELGWKRIFTTLFVIAALGGLASSPARAESKPYVLWGIFSAGYAPIFPTNAGLSSVVGSPFAAVPIEVDVNMQGKIGKFFSIGLDIGAGGSYVPSIGRGILYAKAAIEPMIAFPGFDSSGGTFVLGVGGGLVHSNFAYPPSTTFTSEVGGMFEVQLKYLFAGSFALGLEYLYAGPPTLGFHTVALTAGFVVRMFD